MGTRSITSTQFRCTLAGNLVNTLEDSTQVTCGLTANVARTLTNGVSTGQANRGWVWQSKSLNSGVDQVIDLFDFVGMDVGAGSGMDALGQAMSPIEEIVVIMIVNENASGTSGSLEIQPDSSNGWTPIGTHTVANGGALRAQGILVKVQTHENGFDVTDASSHRLKLTATGGTVTYSVWILGRHDDEESSSSSSSSSSVSSSCSCSCSSQSSPSSESSSSSSSESSQSSSSVSSSSKSSSSSTSVSTSSISTSSSSESSKSSESSSCFSSKSSSCSSISTSCSCSSGSSLSSSSWSS